MRWWKALGVAAFVGVAATGVVAARAERQRRSYTPEQVRDRLRERVAQAEAAGAAVVPTETQGDSAVPGWRRRVLGTKKSLQRSASAALRWSRGHLCGSA